MEFNTLILDSKEDILESIKNRLRHILPSKIVNSLLPHQINGVFNGVLKNGKILIADDMGLGKTVQALSIAYIFQKDWPLLIICPATLRVQWAQQVFFWLEHIKVCDVKVIEKSSDFDQSFGGYKIFITSFSLVKFFQKKLIFKACIIDESHNIKNSETQKSKNVLNLTQNCSRKILLSGTPITSKISEFKNQIELVLGSKCTNVSFKNKQSDEEIEKFKQFILKTCVIKRGKTVIEHLLKKKFRYIHKEKLNINLINNQNIKNIFENLCKSLSNKNETKLKGFLFEWFSISSKIKFPIICKFILNNISSLTKCIIFFYHISTGDEIEKFLKENKFSYIRIDGKTSSKQKEIFRQDFQNSIYKIRFALLSIQVCGTGWDLNCAKQIIFSELFWNPTVLLQAEDRIYRIGQKDDVYIYYIICDCEYHIDTWMWSLIEKKLNLIYKLGLSEIKKL